MGLPAAIRAKPGPQNPATGSASAAAGEGTAQGRQGRRACGQLDEAVEGARAHPEGGSPYAVESLAGLSAGAGRPREAVALLDADRLDHRRTLGSLPVEPGRVEEAVALLRTPRPAVPLPEPTGFGGCPAFQELSGRSLAGAHGRQ